VTLNRQKVEEWKTWLEKIQKDVTWALVEREVYDEFVNAHNDNLDYITEHRGETFCCSIRTWYAFFSGFAVRRQVDNSRDPHNISLRHFLEDLLGAADQFTYEFYLTLFPLDHSKPVHWQEGTFGHFSEDKKLLSAGIIQADMDELEGIRNIISGHIDRAWAHLDKRGISTNADSEVSTYGTTSDALDSIERITRKYLGFLNIGGYPTLLPVGDDSWKQFFKTSFCATPRQKVES
jgi:hypothetical protein